MIAPDRFANGDPSNDSVDSMLETVNRDDKGGRHGGDIQGMIDHLEYIADMGFTQIWTMPLLENDMERYSYHGYSTTDFFKLTHVLVQILCIKRLLAKHVNKVLALLKMSYLITWDLIIPG